MYNTTFVGEQVKRFESSPQFDGYTRVTIVVSEELEYTAGTDTGRTLTIENPWGTQEMAEHLLAKLKGFQYQPFSATGVALDPAAEIGDGVTVHNTYSGIYVQATKYGRLCSAEISAPTDEEIDHEFPYTPKQTRKVSRNLHKLSSELKVQADLISAEVSERKSDVESINSQLQVQADQITAKVSKTGGSASTFGWVLTDRDWTIQANGSTILKATQSGLEVTGKITATSGLIGGFTINSDSISFNNQSWGGTNTTGIYIGPKGIQLGKAFKVDSAGNLTAASGTFNGNVQAKNIQYGGNSGTLSGGAISGGSLPGGAIVPGAVGTTQLSSYANLGIGGGVDFDSASAYSTSSYRSWFKAGQISANGFSTNGLISCGSLYMNNRYAVWKTATIAGVSITYLGSSY